MTSEIEILIKAAVDKAVSDIKKAEKAVDGLADSSDKASSSTSNFKNTQTELRSAMGNIKMVLDAAKQAYDDTIGTFQDYALQVSDMSRATGQTAEDTSRLIQAADDVGISYENLSTSLKMASKQGIDTSVESLKKLSDEYLTLAPGTERMQFLLKNFGRAGEDMGKLMEKGAKGIESLTQGIEDQLVLTPELVRQAEVYRVLTDNLNDNIEAQKVSAGVGLQTIATDILMGQEISKVANALRDQDIAQGSLTMSQITAKEMSGQYLIAAQEMVTVDIDGKIAKQQNADATANLSYQLEAATTAQQNLEAAQRSWMDKTANEVKTALDGLNLSGENYTAALGVIDESMGTSLVKEEEHKKAVEDAVAVYAETGNLLAFGKALNDLKDGELGDMNEALVTTKQNIVNIQTEMDRINGKKVKGVIEIEYKTIGAPPADWSGGGIMPIVNP